MPIGGAAVATAKVFVGVDDSQLGPGLRAAESATQTAAGQIRQHLTLVEEQTLKVELAQGRYTRAVARFGPESAQAKTALINLAHAERDAAQGAEKAGSEAAQAGRRFTLFGRQVNTAEHQLGAFGRGGIAASGAFSHLGRSIAFASGAFLGGVGLVSVLKSGVSEASNLHEQVNKVNVVFKESAGVVKQWSEGSARSMLLARGEALQYAATFGNMLVPMGFARDRAAQMSTRIVQLSADMASFSNAAPTDVLQALQSGLAGMPRPLRQFGVFLDAARIKAEAYSSGLVKADVSTRKIAEAQQAFAIAQAKLTDARSKYAANSTQVAAAELAVQKSSDGLNKALAGHVPTLTTAQKTQAAYNIILKDTKDAQGDVARTSDGFANRSKILAAQIKDLEGELGQALLPTLTRLIGHFSTWIDKANKSGAIQRDLNKAVKVGTQVVGDISAAVNTMWPIFKTAAQFVGGMRNAVELLVGGFAFAKFAGPILGALVAVGTGVKTLGAVFAATLPGLIGVGIVLILQHIDTLKKHLTELAGFISTLFGARSPTQIAAGAIPTRASLAGNPGAPHFVPATPAELQAIAAKHGGVLPAGTYGHTVRSSPGISKAVLKGIADDVMRLLASTPGLTPQNVYGLLAKAGWKPKEIDAILGNVHTALAEASPTTSTGTGQVSVAAGANRAGQPLHEGVVGFVDQIASVAGEHLTITTGSRHNKFVAGEKGVVSQHWTGDAADIFIANGYGPGHLNPKLTRLGQDALIAAGANTSWARMQTGGVFNIGDKQIIFNSKVGGNHYNHLHVGVNPGTTPDPTTTGTSPVPDTGGAKTTLVVGERKKKPKPDPLIPLDLQETLERAEISKSDTRVGSALDVIRRYLEKRIEHERDHAKRVRLLASLKTISAREEALLAGIDKKAAAAEKKAAKARADAAQAAADEALKTQLAGIDAVVPGMRGKLDRFGFSTPYEIVNAATETEALATATSRLAIAQARLAEAKKRYADNTTQVTSAQLSVAAAVRAREKAQRALERDSSLGATVAGGPLAVGPARIVLDPKTNKYVLAQVKPDVDALKDNRDKVLIPTLNKVQREIKALEHTIARLQKHPKMNKKILARLRQTLAHKRQERSDLIALINDTTDKIAEITAALDSQPDTGQDSPGSDNVPTLDAEGANAPGADGGGGGGGGGGPSGPSPAELQAQIDQAVQQNTVGYLGALNELQKGFASNIFAAAFAGKLGLPLLTGGGGTTITVVNNFTQGPGDPHLFSKAMEFELKALLA